MLGPIVAFALVELSIVFHELGHALAMRAAGVGIDSFGIGIPIRGIPSLHFSVRGIRTVISPLLIGGFVKITEAGDERMRSLRYKEQALINGAGILANIFFAGTILMGLLLTASKDPRELALKKALAVAGFMIGLWFLRRIFCAYLIPIMGLIGMGYISVSLFTQRGAGLIGPVGVGAIIMKESSTVTAGILIAGLLSLSLAISNMLPFVPLDGGRTLTALLRERLPRIETAAAFIGAMVFLALIVFVLYGDIAGIFRR